MRFRRIVIHDLTLKAHTHTQRALLHLGNPQDWPEMKGKKKAAQLSSLPLLLLLL